MRMSRSQNREKRGNKVVQKSTVKRALLHVCAAYLSHYRSLVTLFIRALALSSRVLIVRSRRC